MTRRVWTNVAAAGAVTAGALALLPAAAQAAVPLPATCVVVSPGLPLGSCKTPAVEAGDGKVWININTGLIPCQYVVRDVKNDAPVRVGSVTGHYATSISGLYSYYRLELNWCTNGSTGAIS